MDKEQVFFFFFSSTLITTYEIIYVHQWEAPMYINIKKIVEIFEATTCHVDVHMASYLDSLV
jgi:hypothetical protein